MEKKIIVNQSEMNKSFSQEQVGQPPEIKVYLDDIYYQINLCDEYIFKIENSLSKYKQYFEPEPVSLNDEKADYLIFGHLRNTVIKVTETKERLEKISNIISSIF